MLIRVGYDIIFEHPAPTPLIAMLYLHPSRGPSIRRGNYLLMNHRCRAANIWMSLAIAAIACWRLLAHYGFGMMRWLRITASRIC